MKCQNLQGGFKWLLVVGHSLQRQIWELTTCWKEFQRFYLYLVIESLVLGFFKDKIITIFAHEDLKKGYCDILKIIGNDLLVRCKINDMLEKNIPKHAQGAFIKHESLHETTECISKNMGLETYEMKKLVLLYFMNTRQAKWKASTIAGQHFRTALCKLTNLEQKK